MGFKTYNYKTLNTSFFIFSHRASQYIYLNINQLDALNFIMNLFHAPTCFEHTCSSSGGQNYTIQPLISSHLQVAVRCTGRNYECLRRTYNCTPRRKHAAFYEGNKQEAQLCSFQNESNRPYPFQRRLYLLLNAIYILFFKVCCHAFGNTEN